MDIANLEWYQVVEDLSKQAPIGDFVECGVYYGVSARVLAENCKGTLHLFDSWQGIPELSEFDNEFYNTNKWIYDLEDTKKNLSQFDNIKYYKGWYPERFNELSTPISLLHIDASLYMSTKLCLEYFYPKLINGGYLIVNFHNDISLGAKKAVLEMFDKSQLLEHPLGVNLIIK